VIGIAAVVLLVIVPIYLVALRLLIKSKFLASGAVNNAQYKALFTFVGAGLTASAALIGSILVWTHNNRSRAQLQLDNQKAREQHEQDQEQLAAHNKLVIEQQKLDKVVKGLELIAQGDSYARPARVGGALAALVQLGQPVIAMRILDSAWEDGAVHSRTACWLIDEVTRVGDTPAAIDAAQLLAQHADKLTFDAGRLRVCYWPPALINERPRALSEECKEQILIAITRLLVSRSAEWWEDRCAWTLVLLDGLQQDPSPKIATSSAFVLTQLVRVYERTAQTISHADSILTTIEIRNRLMSHSQRTIIGQVASLGKDLESWARPKSKMRTTFEWTKGAIRRRR